MIEYFVYVHDIKGWNTQIHPANKKGGYKTFSAAWAALGKALEAYDYANGGRIDKWDKTLKLGEGAIITVARVDYHRRGL